MTLRALMLGLALLSLVGGQTPEPDWKQVEEETLRHFQALVRLDTSDPPGKEAPAADYLKEVLEREGVSVRTCALEPHRPNLVARLKGTGKKRPLLIMGHTDVVNVDPAKWTFPPFSATRHSNYIYGRGTVDDKDNVAACLMAMLLLKRLNIPLERDVIFLAEAGEEGNTRVGIEYLVKNHWNEIDAEFCLAEGGGVVRTGGRARYSAVQTTEKIPYGFRLAAHGPAGHGSRPLRDAAITHLAQAVARVAAWQTPMRFNDTTRTYFERLATISPPEQAARYNGLVHPEKSATIQEYLAVHEPGHYSMLRTSISPNMLKGGYRINVIPSEAEAILDVRALPDENLPRLVEELKKVINDTAIEVQEYDRGGTRPGAPPGRLDTEAFRALEAAAKRHYGVITLPTMSTGATDMAYMRERGVQCYGIGPALDEEDGPKGFGAHSDQERILESELHRFVRFQWDAVVAIAGAR